MKNIITFLVLSAAAISSMAQSISAISHSSTSEPFQMTRIINSLPESNLMGTTGECGVDELDSTYYMNLKKYEFRYDTWQERFAIDTLISSIVQAYHTDIPHHSGGFCSSNRLTKHSFESTRKLQMYYGSDGNPLIVGGLAHNYAVLRFDDKNNPNYRHIKGIEWWLHRKSKKHSVVYMNTFTLYGPLSAQHYKNALMQSRLSRDTCSAQHMRTMVIPQGDNGTTLDLSNINWETVLANQSNQELLSSLSIIAQMYRNNGQLASKPAIISSINDRIKAILVNKPTQEEKANLFNIINDLNGYYAQIIFADGKKITKSFSWLQGILPRLKSFSTTWVERGDPACSISKPNDRGGFRVTPVNFIYQVMVQNNYSSDFE